MGRTVDPKYGKSYEELLWAQLWVAAIRGLSVGDTRAAQLLMDRAYGKVPDRVAGHDGGPVQLELTLPLLRAAYGPDGPGMKELAAQVAEELG
jgi:hypothetical protein